MTIQEALKQLEKTIEDHVNREATRRAMEAFRLLQPIAKPSKAPAQPERATGYGAISSRVFEFVKANKGCSRADIARATGVVPLRVTNALSFLRRAGKIKATGLRRFATWQAVK